MKPKQTGSTQLNCFSPPVMITTFIIEILVGLYTIWRYKLNVLGRLVLTTVVSLAIFQLAEYHVCTGMGFRAVIWSRMGFVAITLLPALGLHILHVLAHKPRRRLVLAGYTVMMAFVGYFLTYHGAFVGYQCTGNYVIFQIGVGPSIAYAAYYYGLLLTGMVMGIRWANAIMRQASSQAQRAKLQSVRALIVGYLVFLVPTALANSVKPSTRAGIPSIMCGFAVIFALILVMYVLPLRGQKRSQKTDEND